jgi:hypothetical protein
MTARTATIATVSVYGCIAGLAGIEHGMGEVLQGNTVPAGILFASWPYSAFFRSVAGEPAMSLVPNLLASGVLSILASVAMAVCAVGFATRKRGGLAIAVLSIVMLVVGAGFGPPLLGLVVALAATGAGSRRARAAAATRDSPSRGWRRFVAAAWPWLLGASIAAWILVMPGTMLLDRFVGVRGVDALVPAFTLTAFGALALAILTARIRDNDRQRAV